MREAEVDAIFSSWLERHGWSVEKSRSGLDILARRGDVELRVELKGDTKARGTDADTCYGQILRHLSPDPTIHYGLAAPTGCMDALRRVPDFVRRKLGIRLFEVTADGQVIEHDDNVVTRCHKPDEPDSFDSSLLVRPDETRLVVSPFEGVYSYTAYVIPSLGEDDDPDGLDDSDIPRSIAMIRFEVVRFDEAVNAGFAMQDMADAHSQLLHDIAWTVWDENGKVRDSHGMEGLVMGGDLLHIFEIEVRPHLDFFKTARLMVEQVLQQFGGGCGFAAYYTDETPHIQLRPMLLERGFQFVEPSREGGGGIYVLDMSLKRTPVYDGVGIG